MGNISAGKLRGLQQLAYPDGIFAMCAMDHRGSLRRMLDPERPEAVSYSDMVEYKLGLCRALAPHASAVLLDPVYGASQAMAAGALPGTTGLLVSIEATGYVGASERRITELLSGWSVEKTKRMGASAAKLLLYYRPDLEDVAARQLELVRRVSEECARAELPLLVETRSYPVREQERDPREFARIKPQVVIETARQVTALPLDVLKTEFPADSAYETDAERLAELCRELDQASRVPWVVLSAGVDFERFEKEVELACKAGASGFLGGRALWQEATSMRNRAERVRFLETVGVERLKRVARLARAHGTPWFSKMGLDGDHLTTVQEGWYETR